MPKPISRTSAARVVDAQLERPLRMALLAGLALVLLLPAARGYSDSLGWMPLWLVGMPAVALWSLHRFRLPGRQPASRDAVHPVRRRRSGAQARRRMMPAVQRFPRAA